MNASKLFLTLTGASAALAGSSCSGGKKAPDKPLNVVYIMCDDHSYQTVSAYDQRYMRTPNIDRLADEGARFTNSFVANSLSGPSRACLLTGKHSHANGFTNNEHGIFDGSQQTLPKLLQAGGYQTAMVGKWHLVSDPTGFDYWDILTGQGDYYNPVFIRNGERIVRPGYSTDITTDVAFEWLDGRDPDKPFCLFLHYKAPHRSWMPDLQDLGLYDDVTFPLPETFYDDYATREAAAKQEMSIIADMNVVYDLKMADRENEIHTPDQPWLEEYGRDLYRRDLAPGEQVPGRMDAAQQAAWDAYYDPIIAQFKQDNLSGISTSGSCTRRVSVRRCWSGCRAGSPSRRPRAAHKCWGPLSAIGPTISTSSCRTSTTPPPSWKWPDCPSRKTSRARVSCRSCAGKNRPGS